jgi:hypothetical protein
MSAVGGGHHQPAGARPGLARVLGWVAAAGIGGSLLIMIVASAARYSAAVPPMPWPHGFPPLEIAGRLPVPATYTALWLAAIAGAAGVIAGLAAVARGARPPARLLIGAAVVAVVALALLPPAGSTDTLSYATFGRIAALGHNPYAMTPRQLSGTGDPVGRLQYLIWRNHGSLYGPLATLEQRAAAGLGGASPTRIIFWLKLWNAVVFLGVALALDRMLRADAGRRLRAHLLWSVNPLLLWGLIAGGHLDLIAAAAAFFGLSMVRSPGGGRRGPGPLAALGAGVLAGVGADVMLTYLLLAAALAWALRRRPVALASAAAGFLVVFVPAYLWAGRPLLDSLALRRGKVSADNFYQLFDVAYRHHLPPRPAALAALAVVGFALLLLWRLPRAVPGLPAIQPALAIAIPWLFLWYYQLPWYDTMIIALLALYPASRLDYVVIVQLMAGTFALMPGGTPFEPPLGWLRTFSHATWFYGSPVVLLAAAVAVFLLCVSRAWNIGPPMAIRPLSGRPAPDRPQARPLVRSGR